MTRPDPGIRSGDPASDAMHDRAGDEMVSLRSNVLRKPLASMVGFAELIDSGELTDDERHLYAGVVLREGRRLTALLNNAIALQRFEAGHSHLDFGPVDVRALLRRAALAAGKDERMPITLQVPAHLPLVSADAEAILDVMARFLSNARRFSPAGGAIRIGARATGGMVEIYIKDHGIGIDTETLPNLFHKFYSGGGPAGRVGPGAGLGLAINQRVIQAHGGAVEAGSNGRGKGACFKFTLPIARPDPASTDVLIIDDDAAFASLIKAELAAQGLSAIRASDAETAEHILVGLTPRAIVLDLILPGLQGEDFLDRTRARGGMHVPVVVVTSRSLRPADVSALIESGTMAVLPKEAGAPEAAVALIADALARKPVQG
jgi:CheY-like chemotaxis protein